MKGVVLAGGFGTRLKPMSRINYNKHLVRVYDWPMIFHAIDTLKRSGLKEILIVTDDSNNERFEDLLDINKKNEWGVKLSCEAQIGAGGIAAALGVAKRFANGGPVAVILGDNIFETDFKSQIKKFQQGATIFLKKMSGLERFGVPVFAGKKIIFVEEKPKIPKSLYAVTGFYLFDGNFFKIIPTLKRSARNELEITDVVNHYLKNNLLNYELVRGYWADAGTPESLNDAGNWVKRFRTKNA